MKLIARNIVKHNKLIIFVCLLLLIPSFVGIINTKINYDLLKYIPAKMDTMKGQDELIDDFKVGGYGFIVCENQSDKQLLNLKKEVEDIKHVKRVLSISTLTDIGIPEDFIPDDIKNKLIDKDNNQIMAVLFDSSMSDDNTMNAVTEIRHVMNKQCFYSGLTAVTLDLKNLCLSEETMYVVIAVILTMIVMMLFLNNYIVPIIFMVTVGFAVVYNLGTNFMLGEISFITKALTGVLQLAVTMDYSIFLWNSYNEQKKKYDDKNKAMEKAIRYTFSSVCGSSITTVVGFLALCFMTFMIGLDLGIVMAKGVIFGVIICVTLLPAFILFFDKILVKAMHKPLMRDPKIISSKIIKRSVIFAIIFVVITPIAFVFDNKAQDEVYYDFSQGLPEDLESRISNEKLEKYFDMSTVHIIMKDVDMSKDDSQKMISKVEKVKGVNFVLGLDSVIGRSIPEEILPEDLLSEIKSYRYELIIVSSSLKSASDEANAQVKEIKNIVHSYSKRSKLVGQAPCMEDMISLMSKDFLIVNTVSIGLVFLIIFAVEQSIILPIILIAVIELSIFINMGISHVIGSSLSFIAPVCISTIQLGATVDYAILMTTRYKAERVAGYNKKEAVNIALYTSIPSIIVSALGLFMATIGVSLYSSIDMIKAICLLLSRGAIISMICVIVFLPSFLYIFDWVICKTTRGMKECLKS